MNWLALRVPYNMPLPQRYAVLCAVKANRHGVVRRFHPLIKTATETEKGLWIDTADLHIVSVDDIRVFAADISSGLLAENIAFLSTNPR